MKLALSIDTRIDVWNHTLRQMLLGCDENDGILGYGICYYVAVYTQYVINRRTLKRDWPELAKYRPKTYYSKISKYWWAPCTKRGTARRIEIVRSIILDLENTKNNSQKVF